MAAEVTVRFADGKTPAHWHRATVATQHVDAKASSVTMPQTTPMFPAAFSCPAPAK